jgi:hypothetical protein
VTKAAFTVVFVATRLGVGDVEFVSTQAPDKTLIASA